MKLTEHFTLDEATFSEYAERNGISNAPSKEQLTNIINTSLKMEQVRALLGKPIMISSWLRVPELNVAIGGSSTSDHCNGFAIDFRCPDFGHPYQVAKFLSSKKEDLGYDQLIHEFGRWVHISFAPKARKMDLSIFVPGKYVSGILNK